MSTDLQGKQWRGRAIKPYALSLFLSMIVLTFINILNIGVFSDNVLGDVIAIIAGGTATLFLSAWVFNNRSLLEIGLLFAAGVWMTRATFDLFVNGYTEFGIYLSLCWVIGAAGSYLMERRDWRERH